jgi:outer membrane protein assembly factor BamD
MMRRNRPFLALAICVALAGCAAEQESYVERAVHVIYNQAVDAMAASDYAQAAKLFDEVERQHPYSVWATKAQLMAAFAYYQGNKYDEAVIAVDRFIQLHPGSRDIAYAYYLKALSYYEQISDVSRDQLVTEKALRSLQDVVQRFPASKYARDAKLKIDLTRDHLAGKEMSIGRWYLRHKDYLAAINRFKRVVADYQTTTHLPEALHRLVEAYTALGLTGEASKVAAVLGYNYPGNEWYVDSYELATGKPLRAEAQPEQRGFFARAWDWAF